MSAPALLPDPQRERAALRHERVVLVDADDREVGTATKWRAHRTGRLHRAVSVLLLDSAGRLLLQQRAAHKYHSPGLWSNACCGHPRPGEPPHDAAARRLREELGLSCALVPSFRFRYRAALGGGMHEHEVDHVFVGTTDADPAPDAAEVAAWRRLTPDALRRRVAEAPTEFTVWFRLLLRRAEVARLLAPSPRTA